MTEKISYRCMHRKDRSNTQAVILGKVFRFAGGVITFGPGDSKCYEKFMETADPRAWDIKKITERTEEETSVEDVLDNTDEKIDPPLDDEKIETGSKEGEDAKKEDEKNETKEDETEVNVEDVEIEKKPKTTKLEKIPGKDAFMMVPPGDQEDEEDDGILDVPDEKKKNASGRKGGNSKK